MKTKVFLKFKRVEELLVILINLKEDFLEKFDIYEVEKIDRNNKHQFIYILTNRLYTGEQNIVYNALTFLKSCDVTNL